MAMLYISPRLQISLNEFEFTFARSGGPGGQNVNKVNSKAILRWPVVSSPSLSQEVRSRFVNKYANRITEEGDLILTSQKYRDQSRNINSCLEKLKEMLSSVAARPILRRSTVPTLASKMRRREKKYEHSEKKQKRRQPQIED